MTDRSPLGIALRGTAVGTALTGGFLAFGATAGLPSLGPGALAVGLLVLPLAVVFVAAARRHEGPRLHGDELLVRWGMVLHLGALVVALAALARWLLGGGGARALLVAVLWGVAALAYVVGVYAWDRRAPTT